MGKEIERKFLIKGQLPQGEDLICRKISQGYLSTNPDATVRVRVMDSSGFLTVKGKTKGIKRDEFEYEIPIEDAHKMLTLCGDRVIQKSRFIFVHDGRKWELDIFSGNLDGLRIAEIELESEDEVISLPDFIGKEVSDDPRYFNSNLIMMSKEERDALLKEI